MTPARSIFFFWQLGAMKLLAEKYDLTKVGGASGRDGSCTCTGCCSSMPCLLCPGAHGGCQWGCAGSSAGVLWGGRRHRCVLYMPLQGRGSLASITLHDSCSD
jgi:hypothetical protein